MPRTVSWLPRLHEIARAVANSQRSHYDRRDLEKLFQLQPRAVQKLIELFPTVRVGTSRLIDREILAGFLDRVREAEDVPLLFMQILSEKAKTSPRKLRTLVPHDREPISLDLLPLNIHFVPGQMTVTFKTIEELAGAMYTLARVIENDGDKLAAAYEVFDLP